MGKVIAFKPRSPSFAEKAPEDTLNYTPSYDAEAEQHKPDVVEELNKAFGPDNFTFEWLVVTPSGYRVPESATNLPFPQDGYSVVG